MLLPDEFSEVLGTHAGGKRAHLVARFAFLPVEQPHKKTSTVMPFGPFCLNPQCKVGTLARVV